MASVNVLGFMSNIDRDTWVHRLDPRTKLALLVFFSIVPLFFTDPAFLIAYALMTLPFWIGARISLRSMKGPFIGAAIFIGAIFVFNAIRSPRELAATDIGSAFAWYWQLGPLVVTDHSLLHALFMAMRIAVPMTIGLLVISTADPTSLGKGMRLLKLPTEVVFMGLAAIRFLPIMVEQLFNIMDAMRIRGVASTFERTKLVVFPLLITSLRRTRTIGLACESRGFGARQWNEFYQVFRFKAIDIILLATLVILAGASLWARYGMGLGIAQVGLQK